MKVMNDLRTEDNGALLKEEREIASKIETTREPSTFGDNKLGSTTLPETGHKLHGPLKRFRIWCFSIPNSTEIPDWFHHLPPLYRLEEIRAAFLLRIRR